MATSPAPMPVPAAPGEAPAPAPAPATPKPAAPSPEDVRLAAVAAEVKRTAAERMKLAKEREAFGKEREAAAKEKAEYEAWKREREDRRLNPAKYMTAEYGENWYDKLTEVKLNGTPTPDLIASELEAKVSAVRQEMEEREKKLRAEQDEWRQGLTEAEATRAKQEYEAGVLAHIKANEVKYPLVTAFGEHQSVLRAIEEHWNATAKQGADGQWQGELLTAEQASDLIEKRIDQIAEKLVALKSGAQPSSTPAPKPPATPAAKRNDTPQRPAQPTSPVAPAKDDRERLARAKAAWEAVRAANS